MTTWYPPTHAYDRPTPTRRRLRVLVVAPHPDDDAIGCGGTLARLAARGARINVTYVTDGSASHPRSRRFPSAMLRDLREGEARAALSVLGIRGTPQFLRAPDGGLTGLDEAARSQLIMLLASRITALRTQVLFAPWPRDPHPDHVATAAIVEAACNASGRNPARYFYRVWLPVRGEAGDQPRSGEATVCDVALQPANLERKRAAILAHRTQTGAVIDDDPDGFCIDEAMLAAWLAPVERFYRALAAPAASLTRKTSIR